MSGASITITSAFSAASAGPTSAHPSASACFHDGPPRRRPTTTFNLLSRKFSACARPWLPYPSTAIFFPSSTRDFASASHNIFAIVVLLIFKNAFNPFRSAAYAVVRAPSEADCTRRAYLAITHVLDFGAGG